MILVDTYKVGPYQISIHETDSTKKYYKYSPIINQMEAVRCKAVIAKSLLESHFFSDRLYGLNELIKSLSQLCSQVIKEMNFSDTLGDLSTYLCHCIIGLEKIMPLLLEP